MILLKTRSYLTRKEQSQMLKAFQMRGYTLQRHL
jgi:hypothetical protein